MPASAASEKSVAGTSRKPMSPLQKSESLDKTRSAGAPAPLMDNDGSQDIPGQLNSPMLDQKGKPTVRAITTAKQAWGIAVRMRDRAKQGRLLKAGTIATKYDGGEPFRHKEMEATGQSWRANFSTNPLATVVDRVAPQMTGPVHAMDTLTHSTLPPNVNDYPEGSTKSREFCQRISKTIRAWPKWKDFVSRLAKEVILFGNAAPARIDDDWRPRLWNFGETFLAEGCGQHSTDCQVVVFYQTLLLHEFIKLFEDTEIAKAAGYNIPDCIQAANRMTGGENNQTGVKSDPTALDIADAIRDGSLLGWSYENPERKIDLFHVLVRDYTGEVDIWTVDAMQGLEVRHQLGLHERMEDAVTLFTFQSGNGKFYGSKGLGRLLVNLHMAIDRNRCFATDKQYLDGVTLFQGDPKDAAGFAFKIRHPFGIVKAGTLIDSRIQFDFSSFVGMDEMLVKIMEAIAGAFIPQDLDDTPTPTRIEAAEKAARETEVKEGVLGRFFDHLYECVGMMQRAICSADNLKEAIRLWEDKKEKMETKGVRVIARKVWKILKSAGAKLMQVESAPEIVTADEEAVECLLGMLESGMSPEEIVTLSMLPAGQGSEAEGSDKDAKTQAWIANNRANPYVNQKAATVLDATISIGEDRANALVIPDDDQQLKQAAQRFQMIELGQMVDGQPMDVVPSDYHTVHRMTLMNPLGGIIQALQQQPTVALVKTAQLCIQHYQQHVQMDQLTPMDAKQQEMKVMKQWAGVVNKAINALQKQMKEAQKNGQPTNPDGSPAPLGQGQAPQPPIDPHTQLEAYKALAEVEARRRDQALKETQLGLEIDKHEHNKFVDLANLQQGNIDQQQDSADRTAEAAENQANRQLDQIAQNINQQQQAGQPAAGATPGATPSP